MERAVVPRGGTPASPGPCPEHAHPGVQRQQGFISVSEIFQGSEMRLHPASNYT